MNIQRYFIKKKIKTTVAKAKKTRRRESLSRIRDVALIVDENTTFTNPHFKELQKKIKLNEPHFHIFTFKEKKINYNEFTGVTLFPENINWKANITSSEINHFIKQPYDLLIDYTPNNIPVIQLVVARIKASLKASFSIKDKELYNFMIDVAPTEIELFNRELVHYLKILKLI